MEAGKGRPKTQVSDALVRFVHEAVGGAILGGQKKRKGVDLMCEAVWGDLGCGRMSRSWVCGSCPACVTELSVLFMTKGCWLSSARAAAWDSAWVSAAAWGSVFFSTKGCLVVVGEIGGVARRRGIRRRRRRRRPPSASTSREIPARSLLHRLEGFLRCLLARSS